MTIEQVITIILAFVAWLWIGWLPSRFVKNYFAERFGRTLGKSAWSERDEIFALCTALLGPLAAISVIAILAIWRHDDKIDGKRVDIGFRW